MHGLLRIPLFQPTNHNFPTPKEELLMQKRITCIFIFIKMSTRIWHLLLSVLHLSEHLPQTIKWKTALTRLFLKTIAGFA